jgi:hypothetical protein
MQQRSENDLKIFFLSVKLFVISRNKNAKLLADLISIKLPKKCPQEANSHKPLLSEKSEKTSNFNIFYFLAY